VAARIIRKLIASEIAYLDPLDCGSTVGYAINKGRHGLHGNIDLSDCNRHITWYFGNNKSSLNKIDKAVELLTNFKNEFAKAQKVTRVRRPRKKS
jgi:hypothetical protein